MHIDLWCVRMYHFWLTKSVHCPSCTVHCPSCTVHCPSCTVHCPVLHCTLSYTAHCQLNSLWTEIRIVLQLRTYNLILWIGEATRRKNFFKGKQCLPSLTDVTLVSAEAIQGSRVSCLDWGAFGYWLFWQTPSKESRYKTKKRECKIDDDKIDIKMLRWKFSIEFRSLENLECCIA